MVLYVCSYDIDRFVWRRIFNYMFYYNNDRRVENTKSTFVANCT